MQHGRYLTLSQKRPAKSNATKKEFFGQHLELKPAFLQKPKTLEETMAEAFSKDEPPATANTGSTVAYNATQDHSTTLENPTTLDKPATLESLATLENPTTLEKSPILEKPATVEKSPTLDSSTTIDKAATLAQAEINTSPKPHLPNIEVISAKTPGHATVENNAIAAQQATAALKATTEPLTTPATTIDYHYLLHGETPIRLKEDVNSLAGLARGEWENLDQNRVLDYWRGYSLAWHWLEDQVVPNLEKDFKLALRRCYRKAFGEKSSSGKFFSGQTALAAEVGVSKRRIQDIMEIFHQLGWVKKVAHFNRGDRKGTEYEMRLPAAVMPFFYEKE